MKLKSIPARPGDVVLLTQGALGRGRVHWWRFETRFGRPDGSQAESAWLVANHSYVERHGTDPMRFQVIGDIVWQRRFGRSGSIDQDAILAFAEEEEASGRAVTFPQEAFGVFGMAPANQNPLHFPRLHLPANASRTATSLAVLAGGALLLWWGLKSTAPGPGRLAAGAPTLTVSLGGVLTIPSTGAYVALPPGATWASSVPAPYGGTSTTILVQPSPQPSQATFMWIDKNGATFPVTLVTV